MNTNKLGRRIQEARRQKGMTQQELSSELSMTTKYISNIECGSKTPKLETFVAIANALRTDANTLLCDSLAVSDEIHCCELWERLSLLPQEKRDKALRLIEMLVDEI